MNSEKVKEIKTALEFMMKLDLSNKLPYIDGYTPKQIAYEEIFNYINELESENAYKQEHIEMWFRKNEEKKKRIAELEEYIKGNEQDAKAFVKGWKKDLETELKQFAERLKDHPTVKIYSLHNECERIPKAIDEILKEFLEE